MVQKYIVGDAYKQNLFRGIKTIIFNSLILIKLFMNIYNCYYKYSIYFY